MELIAEVLIKPVPEEQINYFDSPQEGLFIDERRPLYKGRCTWDKCLIMATVQCDTGKTFFLVYGLGEYHLKNIDQVSFGVACPAGYFPNRQVY
jgi:hypothetical protein